MKNWKKFCELSYKYLLSIKPESIKEKQLKSEYFVWDVRDVSSLKDIFCRLVGSAQNTQMMPNVIKFYKNKERFSEILFWFDHKKVLKNYTSESLLKKCIEVFKLKIVVSPKNLRVRRCGSVMDSAKFLSQFKDKEDFKSFVNAFLYNESSKAALPMLISKEIKGFWFALSCDFIKELWYLDYCKPDVHIMDVLNALWYCEYNDYDAFKSIIKIAKEWWITPYELDKILWLICSWKFYHEWIEIWSHKHEFINYMKTH